MFGRLPGWYTIYTFSEALAPDGILPGAKFTLRPSLAFCYGSVKAKFHYASWFEAGSKLQVGDQLLTKFEPASIMEFGFYCTALQQRASAKLCGMVQGMELQNFRRRRHL